MTGFTRTTHTVRVQSKNKKFFADVEILDAISFTLPNGFQIAYNITPGNVVNPNIIDNTGDGNGNAGDETSTRASHMQRVTSKSNPKMFFDIEVCDAFTVIGPNNSQFCIKCPQPGIYPYDSNSSTKAVPAITDDTGSGMAVDAVPESTRAQHVFKLLRPVPPNPDGGDTPPPPATDYTLQLLTDVIAFKGPPNTLGMPWESDIFMGGETVPQPSDDQGGQWGDSHAMQFPNTDSDTIPDVNGDTVPGVLSPDQTTTNDITVYIDDPDHPGNKIPPENKDANIYIYFPDGTEPDGDGIGTKGPFLNDLDQAIDCGPLWWIRQLSAPINVWFWYVAPVQNQLAISYFSEPPVGANPTWGYRGFVALPNFSVIYILSANASIVGLGDIGADTLEMAAGGYYTGGGSDVTLSWAGVGYPDGGWGVNTTVVVTGTQFLYGPGTNNLDPGPAELPDVLFTSFEYYMPYGAFDFLGPTSAELIAATGAVGYEQYGGPPPNIWELTGLPQPPLQDPDKLWNPDTNPHGDPSVALAQQCAQTFALKWNAVATQHNEIVKSCNPSTGIANYPNVPPEGWTWNRPYGGNTVPTAMMFSNGWRPSVVQEITLPATIPTIAVAQLNPAVWDITKVLSDGTPPWPYGATLAPAS